MNDYFTGDFFLHMTLRNRYAPMDVDTYYALRRVSSTLEEFKAMLVGACVLYSLGWPS